MRQWILGIWCFIGAWSLEFGASAAALSAAAPPLTPAQTQFFETKIRPLLTKNCYKCHSADSLKLKGELRLDTRDGLLKGGATGPAIVPGDPEKSLLIKAVRYTDPDLQMPPKGDRLSVDQINDLVAWVKMGAPDPRLGKVTLRSSPRPTARIIGRSNPSSSLLSRSCRKRNESPIPSMPSLFQSSNPRA